MKVPGHSDFSMFFSAISSFYPHKQVFDENGVMKNVSGRRLLFLFSFLIKGNRYIM